MAPFVVRSLVVIFLATAVTAAVQVNKTRNPKVWVHMMPWFEDKTTSEDGKWGQHWTMANKNPDIIGVDGRREIACHYYPEHGPYGSADPAVIERQLNQMKYAGIDGVLMDWPGTVVAWDYPKNLRNSEAIINQLERMGLEFAIVYEDHNIRMTYDAGFITDMHEAGKKDMIYMQENYFNRPNYIKVNGRPFLLDFGPQGFLYASDWETVFSVLNPRPHFYTLWHQMFQAEGNAHGEFAWVWHDYLLGLNNFYKYSTAPEKMGAAYPGFHSFYEQGGWPGPTWRVEHRNLETFKETFDLALNYTMQIQLVTWNDFGEGTMIEPTVEFGRGYLDYIQQSLVPQYSSREFDIIDDLYMKRKKFATQQEIQSVLDAASDALANLEPEKAAQILASI